MSIDTESESPFDRLQKFKPTGGASFTKLRLPTGQMKYGYRLKFLKDITIRMNTKFPNPDGSPKPELVATVEFLKVWNDDKIAEGAVHRVNLSRHASCASWFQDNYSAVRDESNNVTGYAAEGKEIDIMIQGKVQGKRNKYWAYAIIPVEGELDLALLGVLLEDEGPFFFGEE